MTVPRIYYDERRKLVVLEYRPRDAEELEHLLHTEGQRTNDQGWKDDAQALRVACDRAAVHQGGTTDA